MMTSDRAAAAIQSGPPSRTGPEAAAVVWLTGLSGSGKSTIAAALVARVQAVWPRVELLDGDALRAALPPAGFGRDEREAHVLRAGYLASRLEHHGVFVVCALISPYAASRDRVRRMCRRFIEVHVATPLDECERRDVKGLYARARRGDLRQFTGVDDPYEAPVRPEVTIDTRRVDADEAAAIILRQTANGMDRGGGRQTEGLG